MSKERPQISLEYMILDIRNNIYKHLGSYVQNSRSIGALDG